MEPSGTLGWAIGFSLRFVSFGPRPRTDTSDTRRFPLASSVSIPYLQGSGRPCPEHPRGHQPQQTASPPCEDGNGARLRHYPPLRLPNPAPPLPLQAEVVPANQGLERHDWRPERGAEDRGSGEEGGRFEGTCRFSASCCCLRKNIGLNPVAGFCFGVAFLAAVARQVIIRTRQQDNSGSVADLVRRGHLNSGQRGIAKPRVYNDPFNNPLVKIDEGTSTAEMFGKEYRLAPVRLTNEQQALHQKRRSRAYQWKRPTVYLKEGDPLPPDVDPDTVRWIPGNHPFAAGSVEVDEETARKNVYQKDGVPSRVKAEHEALRARLEASNDVTPFSSGLRNTQHNERSLSDQPSGNPQHSESEMVNSQPILEPEKQSSDNSSVSKSLEGQ